MHYFIRRPWDLPESRHTAPNLVLNRQRRREFLKSLSWPLAAGIVSPWLSGCRPHDDDAIIQAPAIKSGREHFPAPRNQQFTYDRPETDRVAAAEYTNFYEFSGRKSVYQYIDAFEPWKVQVDGLCARPMTFDLDDLYRTFDLEERAYRLRCVETWAMCVPWTGFPLSELLKRVDPKPAAQFVRFETFNRPQQATRQQYDEYPWPYTEGLTLAEARNPLTLLAVGIYGAPLLKQHGAPVRLVTPWKYGFKSIKSVVRITLTDQQPSTFWNTINPHEYGFTANVDPQVPHPRWSQEMEWMLGTSERYRTQVYNGYGEYVADLYQRQS